MSDSLIYKLALSRIPSVGTVLAKNLVTYCGGVEAVFAEKLSLLTKIPGIGEKIAHSIYYFNDFDLLNSEVDYIAKHGITCYFFTDQAYPFRLKHIHAAPVMLFQKGQAELNARRMVAVVGTRKASAHGKDEAKRIIEEMSVYKPTIISGLAYGIDSCAHKAALTYKLPTVSVFGHGLDRIYPQHNTNLANQILESEGGWLTEFQTGTIPCRENFPKRNRIVAGLVDAVIVVESPVKGGSMITANFGFENNREVMALPGRVNDSASVGCNNLIKTNRASLIESGYDVANLLNWDVDKKKQKQFQLPISLGPQEQCIFDTLKVYGALEIDTLSFKTQLDSSVLAYKLLEMEMDHLVRVLPGKQYELI